MRTARSGVGGVGIIGRGRQAFGNDGTCGRQRSARNDHPRVSDRGVLSVLQRVGEHADGTLSSLSTMSTLTVSASMPSSMRTAMVVLSRL
jgi:hypothetical protein